MLPCAGRPSSSIGAVSSMSGVLLSSVETSAVCSCVSSGLPASVSSATSEALSSVCGRLLSGVSAGAASVTTSGSGSRCAVSSSKIISSEGIKKCTAWFSSTEQGTVSPVSFRRFIFVMVVLFAAEKANVTCCCGS